MSAVAKTTTTAKKPSKRTAKTPKLLSGGNPKIAKGDGDAVVQQYIAAMPGWKHEVGVWLDARITATVPGVRKAIQWNSPFYGVEGKGWCIAFHCVSKYVKVSFFRGTALDPVPPVASKIEGTRYVHVHEGDVLDEAQWRAWIAQAAVIPGWFA
ncbi:MAG: DUF1801 domain-containing protein [Deltaproteobacteria bacterium]|nr:DUF1801 domain-containing protein [Deltaproteobacteria bacterium]